LKNNSKYVLLLTVLYFIISLFGILHHELWLDEAHHWLLARDSHSLVDLFRYTRYEGHPILWNILLYGITQFTVNPFWMQFLHISIATTAVFVFLKKAPFSWKFKTLFIFGYFMLFEYNLISRNYVSGVLFLFLACSIYKDRKEKFTLLCIYLALASNTHLIFTVIGFALFLTILFERLSDNELLHKKTFQLGFWIFLFGIFLCIAQILPPGDTRFFNRAEQIPVYEKFIKGFISLFKGLVTIPDFRTIHFWNSNLLVNLSKPISAILGLLAYFLPIVLFYKNKKVLFFTYVALIGTQLFFYVTQLSATRYDGMNYVIIIMALWIEYYHDNAANNLAFLKTPIVTVLLLIQFFSGMYAWSMDIIYPFCVAKETVDYLNTKKINTDNVISVTCDGTLISPFLEKKVYFLCNGSLQSYCHWNSDCGKNTSRKNIVKMISGYMISHNYAVFVSDFPLMVNLQSNKWVKINENTKVRFLKKFNNSIVSKANYYIFDVSKITADAQ
jgi:hypothetical protein